MVQIRINNRIGRPRFVRRPQVLSEFFPGSPATLWRLIRLGEFPAPHRLGKGISAWSLAELDKWAESQTTTPSKWSAK